MCLIQPLHDLYSSALHSTIVCVWDFPICFPQPSTEILVFATLDFSRIVFVVILYQTKLCADSILLNLLYQHQYIAWSSIISARDQLDKNQRSVFRVTIFECFKLKHLFCGWIQFLNNNWWFLTKLFAMRRVFWLPFGNFQPDFPIDPMKHKVHQ